MSEQCKTKTKTCYCLNGKNVLPNCLATGIRILLTSNSFMTNIHFNSSLCNGPNKMLNIYMNEAYIYTCCVCVYTLIHTCFVQLCHVLNYSSWPAIIWACWFMFEYLQVLNELVAVVALCSYQSKHWNWCSSVLFRVMECSTLQHPCRSSQLPSGLSYRDLCFVGPTCTLKIALSPAR